MPARSQVWATICADPAKNTPKRTASLGTASTASNRTGVPDAEIAAAASSRVATVRPTGASASPCRYHSARKQESCDVDETMTSTLRASLPNEIGCLPIRCQERQDLVGAGERAPRRWRSRARSRGPDSPYGDRVIHSVRDRRRSNGSRASAAQAVGVFVAGRRIRGSETLDTVK